METYYYGRQSILTGRRSGYSVVSTLTEITEGEGRGADARTAITCRRWHAHVLY